MNDDQTKTADGWPEVEVQKLTPVKPHDGPAALKDGESAKDIVVKPIQPQIAKEMVIRGHYSHKVAPSSCLNFGVFWKGKLEGVLQYGHPIDKRKSLTLVRDTEWNGFLELNRMYMSPVLPKNTESRALAVTLRMIRKNLPHVKWVVSYADGTQAGSGTIYRASGFVLTGVRKNQTILYVPSMDECFAKLSFTHNKAFKVYERIKQETGVDVREVMGGAASVDKVIKALGAVILQGYQVRYLYFLDAAYRAKMNVPELPYNELKKLEWPPGIR